MPFLEDTLDPLLRLFCPTPCVGCTRDQGPLCRPCRRELEALPLRAEPPRGLRPLTLWIGPYDGPLRGLIRGGKLSRRPALARRAASCLLPRLERRPGLLALAQGLVHPPVEAERRSFHPAAVAADQLGHAFGLPVLGDLVRRPHGAPRARHLPGRARAAHVARSLVLDRCPPPGLRRVVLVDDLWTTGATARRVTGLLASRGIEVVLWLFLARTPRRDREPPRIPHLRPFHLSGRKKSRSRNRLREPLKIPFQAGPFA